MPAPAGGRRDSRRDHRLASIAAICLLAAIAGAGALATTLWALGAVSSEEPATTVYVKGEGGSAGATGVVQGLSATALYRRAAPGVVDVLARVSSGSVLPSVAPEGREGTQSGAGVLLNGRGDILTAAHVIEGASTVSVRFKDGVSRAATLLGTDSFSDLALLRVSPEGLALHPLTLGSSAELRVGDAIAAIGDPFGYARSLSTGVISGLHREIEAPNGATIVDAIQTDAALNPGNSGGPLLDSHGRVVAIVDQIVTDRADNDDSSGVGFAVPIEAFQKRLQGLLGS